MIDFDEELKHYKPKTEVAGAEDTIHNRDLTDMVDVLKEINRANVKTPIHGGKNK